MKKQHVKKLQLHRETLRQLQDLPTDATRNVVGDGTVETRYKTCTCPSWCDTLCQC